MKKAKWLSEQQWQGKRNFFEESKSSQSIQLGVERNEGDNNQKAQGKEGLDEGFHKVNGKEAIETGQEPKPTNYRTQRRRKPGVIEQKRGVRLQFGNLFHPLSWENHKNQEQETHQREWEGQGQLGVG